METKNNEGRSIYMDDTLLETVLAARTGKKNICPYVFPNESGTGPIKDWRRVWNTACRKIGLGYGYKERQAYVDKWAEKLPAGPIIHDFRRSAVRNNSRAGISDKVTMEITGHECHLHFKPSGKWFQTECNFTLKTAYRGQ
jgi:hypothetical protein